MVGSVLVTLGLFAVTGLAGSRRLSWSSSCCVYLVGQTVASFLVEGRRRAVDRFATTAVYTAFVLAIIPLVSVLATVISQGCKVLNAEFLTHSQRGIGPNDTGGGIYHGIIGTLEIALVTSLISIPIAVLVAVYLVEYGRGILAKLVTFFVDVMTGIPSIVAGLFIYVVWILTLHFQRSGFPACLALSILMIPVVVRSTEEMLKLVPNELRESSLALGRPALADDPQGRHPDRPPRDHHRHHVGCGPRHRRDGSAAAAHRVHPVDQHEPVLGTDRACPLIIFDQAGRPSQTAIDRAWGTALVLIVIVMILNLVARVDRADDPSPLS